MKKDTHKHDLTLEEKATNFETALHIQQVASNLNLIVKELLHRGEMHDRTKLESPEVEYFTEHNYRLCDLEYGSEEYAKALEDLKPALAHHYAKNRHHPAHFKNGIRDMNLIDLVEMFCDWAATTHRQYDGNLRKSLEKNVERFKISDELASILENSIELFERQ
jgi:hypothetical protein